MLAKFLLTLACWLVMTGAVLAQLNINTASPERMVHLEQNLANDGHLKELVAAARAKMAEPSRG